MKLTFAQFSQLLNKLSMTNVHTEVYFGEDNLIDFYGFTIHETEIQVSEKGDLCDYRIISDKMDFALSGNSLIAYDGDEKFVEFEYLQFVPFDLESFSLKKLE